MSDVANEVRGEVSLTLDGQEFVLRPSFEAIAAIKKKLGRSIQQLHDDCRNGALDVELATIATECIKAHGKAVNDPMIRGVKEERIGELIMESEGGFVIASASIALLLMLAATGGYTAKGEPKALPTTSPTTETPSEGSQA